MAIKLGVINEDGWGFFQDVFEVFQREHDTTVFSRRTLSVPVFNRRLNRYVLHHDMQRYIANNEVLFFEWAGELLAVASQLPKRCGIIARLHRYDMYAWINDVNWDAVDKVILVSEAKRRVFVENQPRQEEKTVVIPVGVSLEKFQLQSRRFRGNLGTLCHLKPRKRVYDLVLTFSELLEVDDRFHLTIGGDPRPAYLDYHESLHTLVQKLGIDDKVTFDGHVTDAVAWYKKIDVFISNSYSEGLQVAPMEAMASGCYCLSHFWDGADELLPRENLFLTGQELNEKLLTYARQSEEERDRKREALREMVASRFDVMKTREEIMALVEEVGERWAET